MKKFEESARVASFIVMFMAFYAAMGQFAAERLAEDALADIMEYGFNTSADLMNAILIFGLVLMAFGLILEVKSLYGLGTLFGLPLLGEVTAKWTIQGAGSQVMLLAASMVILTMVESKFREQQFGPAPK